MTWPELWVYIRMLGMGCVTMLVWRWTGGFLARREWVQALAFGLAGIAAILNTSVMAANRGYMPVLVCKPAYCPDGVHIAMNSGTHLSVLADVHQLWGGLVQYSTGDVFLAAAALLFFGSLLFRKLR